MSQMRLPNFHNIATRSIEGIEAIYTSDGATSIQARVALEKKYDAIFSPTHEFNRKNVSYQANRKAAVHSWLKYKEGFSAELVRILLDKFSIKPGDHVLDPFAGSGTTLLVSQERGIDATGIDILPLCHLAWQAKSEYLCYDIEILRQIRDWVKENAPKSHTPFPHVPITESAFSADQEQKLMGYLEYFSGLELDESAKRLLKFALMSILEDISYTRKDGQYLRWDARSRKARDRDARRIERGKKPYKKFFKSKIVDVQQALVEALTKIIYDIEIAQRSGIQASNQRLISDSVLHTLPELDCDQFDAVITSPPYCNRYDYTRTYALELAFSGLSHQDLINLRQDQLSCTVENRSKLDELNKLYRSIGRQSDFDRIMRAIKSNSALNEVFEAIETRGALGHLNNMGVIQMARGYFTELAFVTFELYRICRPGARMAIVNDNVRYGGEVIPVDLLMMDMAVAFGFEPVTIYVLQQRKGNSSQQMGKYGREALRKSIIICRKPRSKDSE